MAIKEDLKPESPGSPGSDPPPSPDEGGQLAEPRVGGSSEEAQSEAQSVAAFEAHRESEQHEEHEEHHDVAPVGSSSPAQLGTGRFVYAAYFAGAIAIAFIVSKVADFAWFKLQNYKPAIGEPRDEIVMPLSAIVGTMVAVYCWYRTRTRQLAEEVATEMSKVTWPSRDEVTNGTFVVIVTTIVSTVFFALMDKFWGFVSNLVYGGT
jgi:preprotein translocase subunit SecE